MAKKILAILIELYADQHGLEITYELEGEQK